MMMMMMMMMVMMMMMMVMMMMMMMMMIIITSGSWSTVTNPIWTSCLRPLCFVVCVALKKAQSH